MPGLMQRAVLALALIAAFLVVVLWTRQPATRERFATRRSATRPTTTSAPTWQRPRSEERKDERLKMVREQIASEGTWPFSRTPVESRVVLEAVRSVPRHWFVPANLQGRAYADGPLPIGHGQTISQPYIVAVMTEALNLTPDSRVLEIGTGSGYQAAVLAEITPHVFSIEILEPLQRQAVGRFTKYGYNTIRCKLADGYFGWQEHAPFDAIIVTCAAGHVPAPLIEQLKVGGKMVIPIGPTGFEQRLVLLEKSSPPDPPTKTTLMGVAFVPMTGQISKEE